MLNENNRNILRNKDFKDYYLKVIDKIYNQTELYNANNINNLNLLCQTLNYKGITEKLKLIENKNKQIFLNYEIFVKGKRILGKDQWNKYKEICLDKKLSYSKNK